MKRMRLIGMMAVVVVASVLIVPVLQAQDAAPSAPNPDSVTLATYAEGFDRPLLVTNAGDGSGRLFVVEQSGKIWINENGQTLEKPFLDVASLLDREVFAGGYSERGLLGLAFAPDYATSGRFFINYTDANGNTVVARYIVSVDDPNVADAASAVIFLTQEQPYPNHNGGHMAFGGDGYLYIGMGDGGSQGDPENRAQNLGTWLGKILRIDVSGDSYTVPADNPFVETEGALPEIWAWGVRNPWRFSFDMVTNDLYMADVGQNQWEEVNFQPADSAGGENYGWRPLEGTHQYTGEPTPANAVPPVAEYSHAEGVSITGGYVYRGSLLPELNGIYFYGDFGTGTIWSLYRDDSGAWQNAVFMPTTGNTISSFGQGEDGELYVVNYTGYILRFEPAS